MSELSEESHGKLDVKRKSRGIAYKLKMFWACEILELAMSPATVRLEPDRLASSEKRNRTTTVRLNRTTTVRLILQRKLRTLEKALREAI